MANNVDLSGRIIPPRVASGIQRAIAVPPIRDVPSEQAVELLWSGYGSLAAGGADFVALTDPSTSANFSQSIGPQSVARLSTMLIYCPDMVSDVAPYLFVRIQVTGQNANAWSFVPVYPRTGVASLTFPMATDLPAGATVQLSAKNSDGTNAHFLAVYLYGWYWPKTLVQN